MGTPCQISGCKIEAPQAIAEQRLCVLHFTLSLEASCAACFQRERKVQDAKPLLRNSLRRFDLATRNLARRSHGTPGIARDDRLHPLCEKSSTPRASAAN